MRKITLLLLALIIMMGLSVVAVQAAPAEHHGNCTPGSRATQFNGPFPQAGFVNERFSTLRVSPQNPTPIRVFQTDATFQVVDHQCYRGFSWVRVDYAAIAGSPDGWSLESEVGGLYGGGYWLVPGTPPPPPPPVGGPCTGSLAPAMGGSLGGPAVAPGTFGRIAETFSTLRTAPAGNAIRRFNAPDDFAVVGGPVCAGNLVWYQIDYGVPNGLGWALESEVNSVYGNNKRWLELCPTPGNRASC